MPRPEITVTARKHDSEPFDTEALLELACANFHSPVSSHSVYERYEMEKEELSKKRLSPEEYRSEIQKISRRLGI